MSKTREWLQLLSGYRWNLLANAFFNLLNALLSLFTFLSIVPFLRILFRGETNASETAPSPEASAAAADLDWLAEQTASFDRFVQGVGSSKALLWLCLGIVVVAVLKNTVAYAASFSLATIRTGVSRDLRRKLYERILSFPVGWFSDKRKGDLISRMTNDLMEVEFSIIGTIEILFKSPIMVTVSLATLFFLSWELTVFSLLFLPLSGYLISRIAKMLKNAAKRGKERLSELISVIEETVTGMRVIQAFNAQRAFGRRFDQANEGYFHLMRKLYKREYLSSPMSETISMAVMAVLLWFGGGLVLEGEGGLSGEWFIGYLVVFSQIIPPARAFSDGWFRIQKGIASVERLSEILDDTSCIPETDAPVRLAPFEGELQFEGVRFSYGDQEVLSGIDLAITKGETVALVGPSGGGKTTLAHMLVRFQDPSAGRITFDGTDLRDVTTADLRSQLGIVTQDALLFNGTVAENIALYSEQAPDPVRLKAAAAAANATEFIERMPGGFAASIGDAGAMLSGGQRQRLSIARALYKDPPILILDEATSALDAEGEHEVQQAINRLMSDRTAVVIAHRLSTIRHADRILVIEAGKITEQGTHDKLMEQAGTYRRLVEMQSFG